MIYVIFAIWCQVSLIKRETASSIDTNQYFELQLLEWLLCNQILPYFILKEQFTLFFVLVHIIAGHIRYNSMSLYLTNYPSEAGKATARGSWYYQSHLHFCNNIHLTIKPHWFMSRLEAELAPDHGGWVVGAISYRFATRRLSFGLRKRVACLISLLISLIIIKPSLWCPSLVI